MRTINLIFAILLIACTSAFANNTTPVNTGNKNTTLTAEKADAKSINLQLENVMADRFTVRLKDASGTVLFFENVKNTHQYAKRFSLNQLTDGDYYFAIDLPSVDEVRKPFSIKNGRINVATIDMDYMKIAAPKLVTFEVKSAIINAIDVQLDFIYSSSRNPNFSRPIPTSFSAHSSWIIVFPIEIQFFYTIILSTWNVSIKRNFKRFFPSITRRITSQSKTDIL